MIFLGAGASACFGIPTTPDLTKEISKKLEKTNLALLKDITVFLEDSHRDYDFENLLTILTALNNQNDVDRNHFSHNFVSIYTKHQKDYTSIIDRYTLSFVTIVQHRLIA